ncbi:hypothetical protein Dsin_011907 [Dipteronia sinensis]|uniref:Transposase MuDR plant domain-containing protein n=1 Tax=Dipteronia sinensis TaxID=43782 RepID=A0AAE0AH53_9ROSI|nr:hypothetical protein Dsin_011907 [Dipteronia sinensis]
MEFLPPTEAIKPQSVVQSAPLLIGETNENIESPNEGSANETSDDEMSNMVSDEDQYVDVKDSDTDTNSERPPSVLVRGMHYIELPSGVIELHQGQLFKDVNHFRQILPDFNIQEGFALNRVKNESRRVTVICKWRVHASPTADGLTYKIKSYNGEHTCEKLTKNEQANTPWIANRYGSLIRSNPDMKISTDLRQKYRLVLST